MISVRQACQHLADGDASAAVAETLPEEGVAEIDLAADTPEGGGNGKAVNADGAGGDDTLVNADGGDGDGVGGDADVEVEAGGSKGGSNGGEVGGHGKDADGDGEGEGVEEGGGGGDGVPISVSCSEDGKTVAVVVSG